MVSRILASQPSRQPPEKEYDIRLFGEAKPPNKLHYARDDVKKYLKKDLDFDAIAILTDGIEWELWVRPQSGVHT